MLTGPCLTARILWQHIYPFLLTCKLAQDVQVAEKPQRTEEYSKRYGEFFSRGRSEISEPFRTTFMMCFTRTIKRVSQSRLGRVVKRYKRVSDGELEVIVSFPWTLTSVQRTSDSDYMD